MVVGVPPDQTVDAAASVAQALFVNNTGTDTEDGIQTTTFAYTDHTGAWTLD